MSPEGNRLLSIAAVIGRGFALHTLEQVAGLAEGAVLTGLEEALKVGVLEDQSRPGTIRYRFAHAFFRQTLYEEMITPRRLRLHQQVARALEAQYAARPEEHAAELAEHFAQSSDPAELAKAVAYSELGAQRAVSVYAYSEAVRPLEQALAVQEVLDPDDKAKRSELFLALGGALMPAGESRRAFEQAAELALALAEQLAVRSWELGSPVAGRQFARNVSLRPLLWQGRGEEALAALLRDAQLASATMTPATAVTELRLQAHLGRVAEAQAVLLETAVLAGDREHVAFLVRRLAPVSTYIQVVTVGPYCVACQLGAAAALLGDREGARLYYNQALEVCRWVSFRPEVALIRLGLAELCLDEAEDAAGERSSDLRREANDHLDFAIGEFRAMKMQPSLERALRHKGFLKA